MKIADILSKVKVPANVRKLCLKASKHAPEILVVAGAGMIVSSTVLACKQTLKASDILYKAEEDLDTIENAIEVAKDGEYTETDIRNDKIKVYSRTAIDLTKTYAFPIILGVSGFAMMFGAHKILRDRNATLTIAYSNLLAAYNAYRDKVVKTLGEEKEFQLRSGYLKDSIEFDNGEKNVAVKNARIIDSDGNCHSVYARIFDETCPAWSRNPTANLTFLRAQQNYANDKLRADGYLFLNDVYQMLGFPRSSEGQIVGWIYDPSNSEIDSMVDFGIYDKLFIADAKRDFINGYEPCVWLDFNVDGVVYDLI